MMSSWFQLSRWLTNPGVNLLLPAFLVFVLWNFIRFPGQPKALAYGILREAAKKQLEYHTTSWETTIDGQFVVRYKPENRADAVLVLETAKENYQIVSKMMGYRYKGKIPLVIYPDKKSLNTSFGWEADASAMGVYWAGAIRVLAPNQWAGDPLQQDAREKFKEEGPVAHELTHLLVDYRTRGNYPRWLTEGIAQYVERAVIGFQFPLGDNFTDWYCLQDMDAGFDNLHDQSLAYYQSLMLVDFLVSLQGEESINELLNELSKGRNLSNALQKVYGLTLEQLEQVFRNYYLFRFPGVG